MTSSAPALDAWLDAFFASYHRHRPVNATFIGEHEHDPRLPDWSEHGVGDALADAEELLRRLDALPPEERAPAQAMDARLAAGFLRTQLWELASGHFQRGNPSLYTGEAVFGIVSLFLTDYAPVSQRVEAARARLDQLPRFLAQLRDNVEEAPASWTDRAIRECRGALALLGGSGADGLDLLAAEKGFDPALLRREADGAARAFSELQSWLETDLRPRDRPDVACGDEAFDLHLREGHFLSQAPDELVRYALAEMDEARAWLEEHARDFGAATPEEALERLADLHPDVDGYLARHRVMGDDVHRLAEEHRLLTWPDFPLRYVPRSPWTRAAAPWLYFLFYRSPAATDRPPVHDYLVTPIESSLPPEEQRALLRAHNDSVIKLNHVVHHGSIGHHVQNWHAFRAASRVGRMAAVDCASRIAMLCGGTMAEGWACYATDLVAEFGGLTPLEAYAERHTRVRMACRAVVDVELHRGRMTLEDAVAFYRERAGMSEGAAAGEAAKNSMFPGGAVMYLFGTDAIHDLRRKVSARQGSAFDLARFHDAFLSHGSVPVALVAESMSGHGAPGPERSP
ncbi:MAG: DUF885 domain-containing protein [Longimicrobiales bacterium]|nr:DUF885 domain-containing protein [Longimicrobiales bacterium]